MWWKRFQFHLGQFRASAQCNAHSDPNTRRCAHAFGHSNAYS
jgi:hypothetical protein